MKSLKNSLENYQKLLQETEMQSAYKELIKFIKKLQMNFESNYPEYEVAKGIYQGYLDLSFFAFRTEQLKVKQLKIEVVFLHKEMRFEAWLSGRNRIIMSAYHKKLEGYNLGKYLLTKDEKGMSAILEGILISNPNFDNLNELTSNIENEIVGFVKDVEDIISEIN